MDRSEVAAVVSPVRATGDHMPRLEGVQGGWVTTAEVTSCFLAEDLGALAAAIPGAAFCGVGVEWATPL